MLSQPEYVPNSPFLPIVSPEGDLHEHYLEIEELNVVKGHENEWKLLMTEVPQRILMVDTICFGSRISKN